MGTSIVFGIVFGNVIIMVFVNISDIGNWQCDRQCIWQCSHQFQYLGCICYLFCKNICWLCRGIIFVCVHLPWKDIGIMQCVVFQEIWQPKCFRRFGNPTALKYPSYDPYFMYLCVGCLLWVLHLLCTVVFNLIWLSVVGFNIIHVLSYK